MTTKTPYDAEVREDLPYNSVSMRLAKARREAYLRALADTQPRIDALVAALEGLMRQLEGLDRSGCDPNQINGGRLAQARAALKLAEGPPTP